MKHSSTSKFWNLDEIRQLPFDLSQINEMKALYPAAMNYVLSRLRIIFVNDPKKKAHSSLQHISSRLKSPNSIVDKLQRRNFPIDYDTMKKKFMILQAFEWYVPMYPMFIIWHADLL